MIDTPWTEGWVKDGADRWVQTFPDGVLVTLRLGERGYKGVLRGIREWWEVNPGGDTFFLLQEAQRAAWQAHTPEGRAEAARFAAMNKAQMDVLAEAERALFSWPLQGIGKAVSTLVDREIEKMGAGEPKRLKIGDAVDLPLLMWRGRLCAVTEEVTEPAVPPRDTRHYTLKMVAPEQAGPVCGHCGQPAEAVGTPDTRCLDCLGGRNDEHHICQPCWQAFDRARKRGADQATAALKMSEDDRRLFELVRNPHMAVRQLDMANQEIARLREDMRVLEEDYKRILAERVQDKRAQGENAKDWEALEKRVTEMVVRWWSGGSQGGGEQAGSLQREHAEVVDDRDALRRRAQSYLVRAEKAEADVKACQEVYAAARDAVRALNNDDVQSMCRGYKDVLARLAKAVGL